MSTCLVVITHNRLPYTQKCLESVLADDKSQFELYIWDNASTDGTQHYLRSVRDPRLKDVVLCEENLGQTVAMNRIWSRTHNEFVAKLDNDCLVSPGWLEVLTKAHRDVKEFGVLACWHFRPEDFDPRVAGHKIREVGGHRIFQHPFVCGSGFVMKRKTFEKMGAWPEGSPDIGTTDYFLSIAAAGYVNGWYYPFILQHHMDDPLSPYCWYHDDDSLRKVQSITYTLRVHHLDSMQKRLKRRAYVLRNLMHSPTDPKYYYGWRRILRGRLPILDRVYSFSQRFAPYTRRG